jgi:MFS transporter, putative metabolite transport protein
LLLPNLTVVPVNRQIITAREGNTMGLAQGSIGGSSSQEIVIRSVRDVTQFVNTQPTSQGAWLVVLVALGGVFVDAYDFTSLGIGVPQLKSQFGLSPLAVGSVTAAMAFGAFFGALLGGYYTDKVGRFKMFLLDLIFLVVAAIGAALSSNLIVLLAFRFLMGIGVGLDFPVALSFIAEFVGSRKKGGHINLWQPMWFIAACSTGLIVLPFYYLGVGDNLWRIAVGFGSVPAFIVLLLRYRYMNESPMWAAHYQGLHTAAKVLERTYGVKVRVIEGAEPKRAPKAARFQEIFSEQYRWRTLLATIICMTQSMEYFAVGFNLPTISTRLFGTDFLYAIVGAVFFNIFGIIGGLTNSYATAAIGVRRLAAIGYVIVIASLLAIWFGGQQMSLHVVAALICLFIFGHSFGPGSQGMTMATLSYPTRIRGTGTGWAQGMLRVGSILGFYFFPLVVAAVGLSGMMLYLAAVPLLGLIAVLTIRWEPVGQAIDEKDLDQQEEALNVAREFL